MSLRFTLLVITAIVTGACSTPKDHATSQRHNFDVVILPTEEFPTSEAIKVATTVADDTGLQIKVVLPIGTRDW